MDNRVPVRLQGEVLMVLLNSFYLAELPFNTEALHASAEIKLLKVERRALCTWPWA